MSYATLLVYINADHVSKQLAGVAAGVADKFSANLVGLSALAVMPPFVAEGVVIVDNASEFDIAKMKARLADAGNNFRASAGGGRESRGPHRRGRGPPRSGPQDPVALGD